MASPMLKVNCIDILLRAIALIETGPLPESHTDHGEYCPYCAIALAKSQLDHELGTGISNLETLRQVKSGLTLCNSDMSLVEAKQAIGKIPQPFTRDATLLAFNASINAKSQ